MASDIDKSLQPSCYYYSIFMGKSSDYMKPDFNPLRAHETISGNIRKPIKIDEEFFLFELKSTFRSEDI